MIPPTSLLSALAIYIFSVLAVVIYARRRTGKGLEEFYIGGRKIRGFISAMTYAATTYSVFMMVGLVGLTYAYGVGALGFELTYLMATLILLFIFAPKYWVIGRKLGLISPAQIFSERYDSKYVGAVMAILSLVFLIPYMSIQAMGSAYLLDALSRGAIPYFWGATFIVIVMTICALLGGFRGVAWTDALQGLIMITSSLALLVFLINQLGGLTSFLSKVEANYPNLLTVPGDGFFTFQTFLTLTLPWAFFALSNPQVSQRLLVPKDKGSLKVMVIGFFVFGFIYTLVSVTFGFIARAFNITVEKADMAMPLLLQSYVPPSFALIVLIGIVSAGVTTVNSIMLTLASMVGRDIYRPFTSKYSERREQVIGFVVILVEAFLIWLFALKKPGLISLLAVMASAGLLVQIPTIIGGMYWRKGTATAAILSMLLGATVTALLYVLKVKILGFGPPIFGFLTSLAIYICLSLRGPKSDFVDRVNQWLKEAGFPL